jgi:hypothetical protein
MRPPIEFLFPPELASEIIYSFVIIVCSMMIYFSTKEMYELSSYKGLKYFRLSFLFFALAYLFRYFVIFVLMFFDISPRFTFSASVFVFIYSSCMAVFYLLYSVMWKKGTRSLLNVYLFNLVALLISLFVIFSKGQSALLLTNLAFFVFAAFILVIAYKDLKDKKRGKGLIVVYLLLFIFFFLNVINVLIPKFLQIYNLIVYLASILIFMTILYRVLKKAGN